MQEFNNQNHSTSPVLLYCQIRCTSLGEIISHKQTEPVLNQACRSTTGCLKPTNVKDIYLIAGIAPPDIRREVCARVDRTKQTKDERHSLFGHTPAPVHLKSRHPFCQMYNQWTSPQRLSVCEPESKAAREVTHRCRPSNRRLGQGSQQPLAHPEKPQWTENWIHLQ